MLLKVDLDQETFACLQEKSSRELRVLDKEALALLRQALGLPFPYPAFTGEAVKCSREAASV
jgi:hypothetical protein